MSDRRDREKLCNLIHSMGVWSSSPQGSGYWIFVEEKLGNTYADVAVSRTAETIARIKKARRFLGKLYISQYPEGYKFWVHVYDSMQIWIKHFEGQNEIKY